MKPNLKMFLPVLLAMALFVSVSAAPTTTIASSAASAYTNVSYTITATATEDRAGYTLQQVVIFENGLPVASEPALTNSVTKAYTTQKATAGNYAYYALGITKDASGNEEAIGSPTSVTVVVSTPPTNTAPSVRITPITSPVEGIITISGTSADTDPGDAVESVQIKIDSGDWLGATLGTAGVWSYRLDTTALTTGSHTITARAYDGTDYTATASQPSVTFTVQQSKLVLQKIEVEPDDDARPGEDITIQMKLKNPLSYEAKDIEIEAKILGINNGDYIKETLGVADISAGDNRDDLEIKMTLPTDADEGKYDLELKVSWYDNTDTYKSFIISGVDSPTAPATFDSRLKDVVQIEQADHDVTITGLQLSSETIRQGKLGEIAVTLENVGSNDEDIKLKVYSTALDIEQYLTFELKQGKELVQYIPFEIPADAKPGNYILNVVAFYKDNAKSVSDSVVLKAAEATAAAPAVSFTPTTVTVSDSETTQAPTKLDINTIISIIAGLVVLIVIIGVILTTYFAKPEPTMIKKREGR